MSGHHNTRIYTTDDNPWCPLCQGGEVITGTTIFKDGGVICWGALIPTKKGCKGFVPKNRCSYPDCVNYIKSRAADKYCCNACYSDHIDYVGLHKGDTDHVISKKSKRS